MGRSRRSSRTGPSRKTLALRTGSSYEPLRSSSSTLRRSLRTPLYRDDPRHPTLYRRLPPRLQTAHPKRGAPVKKRVVIASARVEKTSKAARRKLRLMLTPWPVSSAKKLKRALDCSRRKSRRRAIMAMSGGRGVRAQGPYRKRGAKCGEQ